MKNIFVWLFIICCSISAYGKYSSYDTENGIAYFVDNRMAYIGKRWMLEYSDSYSSCYRTSDGKDYVCYASAYLNGPQNVKRVYTVPSNLGGYPVAAIHESAFEKLAAEEVIVPEGITGIYSHAFSECSSLKNISLPSTLRFLGDYVFESCSNLKDLTLPSGVTSLRAPSFPPQAKIVRAESEETSTVYMWGPSAVNMTHFCLKGAMPSVTGRGKIGSDTMTVFVSNPSGWEYDEKEDEKFWPKGATQQWKLCFLDTQDITLNKKGLDLQVDESDGKVRIIASSSMDSAVIFYATNTSDKATCWDQIYREELSFDAGTTVSVMALGRDGTVAYAAYPFKVEKPVISPADMTEINDSQTVSISCGDDDAVIHYTIDGSDPTEKSPVYKRFRVSGKTTVKAIAVKEGYENSDIAVAHYALGQCPDPVISTTGGEMFYHKGNQVSIAYDCEEGVVHYTTDGSDPTKESPVYEGPFTTDESMVVKAKAFSDNYFDSAVVTATLTREWETVATPVITAAESFTGAKTKVDISCGTEGATIRYTLNGSYPNSHAKKYTGPFYVTEGCTVKAYAVLEDYTNSEIAAKTITKVWGIGDSVALPDQKFTTSGDAEWVDASGEAMKSGAITDEQKSILSTMFVGKGVLSFKWKVSCEDDEKDSWDHAAFFVDGAEIKRQYGITDWLEISHSIETDGSHTVEWVYVKDDAESDNDDCMWVKDIVWMPEKTQASEVKVETTWLKAYFPTLGSYYFDYEEKANDTAANGINKVWEAYLIGLDPTDSATKFVSSIAIEDGKPVVSWDPDLGGARAYKILGSTDLKTWVEVPEGHEADYNFFKVSVEMP